MSYNDPEPIAPPVPQCAYLKRKGATVSSVDDLLAWSVGLSEHPELYEPFTGKMPKADLRNRPEAQKDFKVSDRIALLMEGIAVLDYPEDYSPQGLPTIEALRKVVDEDVTLEERNEAWRLFDKSQLKTNKKKK